MSFRRRWIVPGLICLSAALSLSPPCQAKMSTWKDVQGTSFKGEPSDILGPFAVFRTGGDGGRRVLLRAFSREDCLRFHAEIATLPPRADRFAEAKGYATGELPGRVERVQDRDLVRADLSGLPEPDLLLVLGASNKDGSAWFMTSTLNQVYRRVQRVYPGLMAGVYVSAGNDIGAHRNIAIQSGMPWLVSDLAKQAGLAAIHDFIPRGKGSAAVLATRHGVPLVASQVVDVQSARLFVDQVSELLWQIDPVNPASWPDRLHYLNAIRPVEHARDNTGPLLVGSPLRPDVLRKYGVRRVAARLAVAPDGKVTPTLLSGPADVPVELGATLTAALARVIVAPAVEQGRLVTGSLDYVLEVPPADPLREAEHVWLSSTTYPVLPITDWLVLRPIKVSEQDFESSVVGEKADGTVILSAFEVNSGKISRAAQMSAFNSDWFTAAGADSVRPKAGDQQKIDDETVLTWENVRSEDGFVNMQTGISRDYTVGYAWAEFMVPKETDAWLGLGSDDGVKLWLNGELVHDKWIRRPSRMDDDVVPLHLKKGPNRILIKIQNATIDWSFMYRLRLKP